jgi:HEAT repeat protein
LRAPSPVPPSQSPDTQTLPPSAPGRFELSASPLVLFASENDEARGVALAMLANLEGELAVETVSQALHEEAPWLRETAVEALASLGGESAMQGLQQALEDENVEVQQAA